MGGGAGGGVGGGIEKTLYTLNSQYIGSVK